MKLALIGCGKMGLPLAVQAASKGISVIGVDINENLVSDINEGKSPIDEPGVEELLREAVKNGKLKATTKIESFPMFIIKDGRLMTSGAARQHLIVPSKIKVFLSIFQIC